MEGHAPLSSPRSKRRQWRTRQKEASSSSFQKDLKELAGPDSQDLEDCLDPDKSPSLSPDLSPRVASDRSADAADPRSAARVRPKAFDPLAAQDLDAALGRHLQLIGRALCRGQQPLDAQPGEECRLRSIFLQSAEEVVQGLCPDLAPELTSPYQSAGSADSTVRKEAEPTSSYLAETTDRDHLQNHNHKAVRSSTVTSAGSQASQASGIMGRRPSLSEDPSSPRSVTRRPSIGRGWDKVSLKREDSTKLYDIVMSWYFESFFALVIALNTLAMIIEEQYEGSIMGHALNWYTWYGSDEYNQQFMPLAKPIFKVTEIMFASIFTLEAFLRMVGRGWEYWRDKAEIMDLCVVLLSNASLFIVSLSSSMDITLFRLLRLARLLRIVKLVRTVEQLDSLQLMMTALYSSFSALCWAVVLLFIMQSFVALILTDVFRSEYLLPPGKLTEAQRLELFEYFGTYARAMLSTFELMLANWPPICRFLTENLHEGWMVVVVAYKLTFGFAFISVINAVFMQETLNVAVTDDNIMIRTKVRTQHGFRRKMEKLLKLADSNQDGHLSLEEFRDVLSNPGVKTWLEAMDMETRDGTLLFRLLDKDGDNSLSVDELASGFAKLKGAAKSLDTQLLVHTLRRQWFPEADNARGDEVLIDGVSSVLRPSMYSDPFSPRAAQADISPGKLSKAKFNSSYKDDFLRSISGG